MPCSSLQPASWRPPSAWGPGEPEALSSPPCLSPGQGLPGPMDGSWTSPQASGSHRQLLARRWPGRGCSTGGAAAWPRGTYQMLVVEEVHHAGRPVAHGDEVGGRPVQAQQAQGGALLHAVHGVSARQTAVTPAPSRRPGPEPTDNPPSHHGSRGAPVRGLQGHSGQGRFKLSTQQAQAHLPRWVLVGTTPAQ